MLMLGSFLWLSLKDIRFNSAAARLNDDDVAHQPYTSKLLKRKRSGTPLWNIGLAICVAAPVLMSSFWSAFPLFANTSASAFVVSRENVTTPYFGISFPSQLLKTQPAILAQDLKAHLSIVGRTQDIVHDHFDKAWAEQLAAEQARPWITLQFGEFGANRQPPLDASLPSIINGVHDQEISNWAQAIRNYGKPVYLTILLQADKNWSLSSGVANGGIPEDVPQAWMHVRDIFNAEGARNVAWVWDPADPLHDQQFAPPASSIDVVLQSFINYPGTTWGDPEKVLNDLVHRYPNKPIMVEASTDGPAQQKAEWLAQLGQAVDDIPQVYALLYHEGGPGLSPTSSLIKNWSLDSDNDSLTVMRRIVVDLHNHAVIRSY